MRQEERGEREKERERRWQKRGTSSTESVRFSMRGANCIALTIGYWDNQILQHMNEWVRGEERKTDQADPIGAPFCESSHFDCCILADRGTTGQCLPNFRSQYFPLCLRDCWDWSVYAGGDNCNNQMKFSFGICKICTIKCDSKPANATQLTRRCT